MKKCQYGCINGKIFLEAVGRKVDCPECRNITKVIEKQEDGKTLYDKLYIPSSYKNEGVVDKELFNYQILGAFSQSSIQEVSNLLERINKAIYNEGVMKLSCYIHVPNFVDIKKFVYGSQKLAIEKGLGVTPFISLNTLYGIQKAGDYPFSQLKELENKEVELRGVSPELLHAVDGYRVVQHTNLTYYDFISADLCFVEATANTTEKGWTALADLLGERAKKGLPTYVIGYWGTKNAGYKNSGLRYLLSPEGVMTRLDLIVPFELKSKRGEDEISIPKNLGVEDTKSDVSAGISLESILRLSVVDRR